MINLLPESIKEDMVYGRKNRQITNWIITSLFGVLILLSVAGFGRLTIQSARDQTLEQKQSMETQLDKADYSKINESYGSYVNGLSNVKKLYGQQILYTRLIRKLGTLLPTGARLTNIAISDKDRAIGLNFDNDSDGLGPVIQLNLTDQSKQVSDKTRAIFNDVLDIPLSGDVSTDSEKQTLEFYVSAKSDKDIDKLKHSLQTGGDLAFEVIKSSIPENIAEYLIINEQSDKNTSTEDIGKLLSTLSKSSLQIRGYKVDNSRKFVDFTVRANSLSEAKLFGSKLTNTTGSLFIETYSFMDSTYTTKQKCKDTYSKATTCTGTSLSCNPTSSNGCQYIVRAYYDEIYTSSTIADIRSTSPNPCNNQCTHKINVQYSQLFKNVDLNRVSACTVDATTNQSNCPVEMRAEFSDDAKFYLINLGATK